MGTKTNYLEIFHTALANLLVLFKHFRERLQEKWEGNVQHLDEVPTADLDRMYIMYTSGNGK